MHVPIFLIKPYIAGCMKFKLVIAAILLSVINACNYRPVNPALWTFGNPERRFQKVLDYYSDPEDSLKLRAAEFLIENMGEHFYYQARNQEEIDTLFRNMANQISLPELSDKKLHEILRRELINIAVSKSISNGIIEKPEYKKRSDIKTISPEFLIENIEYAFKAWNLPWARNYSFDEFCRYILPYRYGNEPPGPWRRIIYERYNWLADSVENTKDPLMVASYYNKQFNNILSFSKKTNDLGFKLKVTNQFEAMVYRNCIEQAGFGVCMLRAIGIPATVVSIPKWGHVNYGHELTGMLDAENTWHYFNFAESGPETDLEFAPPKMFFKRFDKMNRFYPVLEDASEKLIKVVDLEVEIFDSDVEEVYLCVFGNLEWSPICKGRISESKAIFENVGCKKRMYLAAEKSNDKLIPVSRAFSTDSIGRIAYFKPDYSKTYTASLSRKWPYWTYVDRITDLIGGEFSVSENRDFTNKQSIYNIEDTLNYCNNILKCKEGKAKFFRYDFPQFKDSVFDGPAEISFYTSQNNTLKKINGKYFGASQFSGEHVELMTDNDILTYAEVWDYKEDLDLETGKLVLRKDNRPLWIAMELDSAVTVTHVGICPRNDKNGIYAGMHYELFYWDDNWESLGVKMATGDSISFDGIPENAVLWLRNLDEGKEERIFTLEEGEQIWW